MNPETLSTVEELLKTFGSLESMAEVIQRAADQKTAEADPVTDSELASARETLQDWQKRLAS